MNAIPNKCIECKHANTALESVHQGWNVYQMEIVVRCDCNPCRFRVGCACADMYCKKGKKNDGN